MLLYFPPNSTCNFETSFLSYETISFQASPCLHISPMVHARAMLQTKQGPACKALVTRSRTQHLKKAQQLRPICISHASKILEKLFKNRLDKFINKHNLLYDSQYGFKKNHSTALALTESVEITTDAIDQKLHSIGIFIDLKKLLTPLTMEFL